MSQNGCPPPLLARSHSISYIDLGLRQPPSWRDLQPNRRHLPQRFKYANRIFRASFLRGVNIILMFAILLLLLCSALLVLCCRFFAHVHKCQQRRAGRGKKLITRTLKDNYNLSVSALIPGYVREHLMSFCMPFTDTGSHGSHRTDIVCYSRYRWVSVV